MGSCDWYPRQLWWLSGILGSAEALSPRSEEGSHSADGLFQCIFALLAYRLRSGRSLNEKDLLPPQGSATCLQFMPG